MKRPNQPRPTAPYMTANAGTPRWTYREQGAIRKRNLNQWCCVRHELHITSTFGTQTIWPSATSTNNRGWTICKNNQSLTFFGGGQNCYCNSICCFFPQFSCECILQQTSNELRWQQTISDVNCALEDTKIKRSINEYERSLIYYSYSILWGAVLEVFTTATKFCKYRTYCKYIL